MEREGTTPVPRVGDAVFARGHTGRDETFALIGTRPVLPYKAPHNPTTITQRLRLYIHLLDVPAGTHTVTIGKPDAPPPFRYDFSSSERHTEWTVVITADWVFKAETARQTGGERGVRNVFPIFLDGQQVGEASILVVNMNDA